MNVRDTDTTLQPLALEDMIRQTAIELIDAFPDEVATSTSAEVVRALSDRDHARFDDLIEAGRIADSDVRQRLAIIAHYFFARCLGDR